MTLSEIGRGGRTVRGRSPSNGGLKTDLDHVREIIKASLDRIRQYLDIEAPRHYPYFRDSRTKK